MTTLAQYDQARTALAEATRIDQVLPILDEVAHVKLYARQIEDQALLADAAEFQLRAERRLGVIIQEGKAAGHFCVGRRPRPNNGNESAPFPARLEDVGVKKRLSGRAQKQASISERAFEAMVDRTRERIRSGGATIIDGAITTQDKQERRAKREQVLGACQQALPERRYGVILADPEWRFEPWSRTTGMDRAADNHYPTSCTEVIAARDVPSIAADDCVLFLWAIAPMLPHALMVMAAWGFEYKSHLIWDKQRQGTGYWFRNAHELLLVGTRGNVPAPAMGMQAKSVQSIEAGEHSAKPEAIHRIIEHYFPTLPKIELNRRGPARPGWDAWGNETETEAPPSLVEPAESVPSSPEAVGSPNQHESQAQ